MKVVVHYTEKGADKTAVGVDDLGKDTLKVSEGTVTKVDEAARTVTVKTKDGAEDTYQLSKTAVVDTSKGVAKGAKARRESHRSIHRRRWQEGRTFLAPLVTHSVKSTRPV